jgi:hypothetical protein
VNKYVIGAIVLISLAIVRVASTYTVFNSTYDEPAHIACGMEWLQWGNNTCELQHPPLARIAVALGPFLKGLRLAPRSNVSFYDEGNAILYSEGQFWSNLTWARIGTLPFLVLLCAVTFLWARRWFSEAAGFWAVLLLVCTSPILGHAGLATNDAACAAGAALALYQFLRWLEQPTIARSLWWGIAAALAVLCKFSNIPFLATCFVAGLIIFTSQEPRGAFKLRLGQIGLAACVVFMLVWATYRFTIIPPATFYGHQHPVIDNILSSRPLLRSVWNSIMTTPLPLAEPIMGMLDLFVHNAVGHDSYLLGQWSQSGWWYFFPVVLAVKSPIGLLVLAMCGGGFVLRRWRETDWEQTRQQVLTAVFPVAILLVCMLGRIDLGVRHILPVYPLLAIIGGHAVTVMLRHSRYAAITAGLLAAWVIGDSMRAHPDYLAHFNEFAGSRPEKILCESDLDWGQDLDRLRKRLDERGVREFSIAYFGTALLDKAGLPHYEFLSTTQPTHGYIAISLHELNMDYKKDGSFGWLKSYTPIERIGKSIDLFYVAP